MKLKIKKEKGSARCTRTPAYYTWRNTKKSKKI